ncbi:ABC-type branched-chain amino acid transport systems, periplasmic component [hydrothermal vent metagenome]|uniref:ABC-type branched-chain amino acid transport systems, periplasmic component n=1 Tax=hydrothermal vent metagenome TaxID=652676 RepID=A0A3B0TEG1_9ZZZZ
MKSRMIAAAFVATFGAGLVAETAAAQEGIFVPLLTYRTGAFAGSGIPVANGMADYLNMLNERDGGIGGVKLIVEECETGYKAQQGVECYESTKTKGAVIYNPYSTGITLQLIPKAPVDKIPVLSMGYGLSAAADGEKFPWTFNIPATYWDQASAIIKYIAGREGGEGNLKGKKIGFIYLDAGYGREPIPVFKELAEAFGYELFLVPVAGKDMQNQASQWLNVRREKPDWMIMWGWGAMNPTAIKEAAKIRFPMDKFIGVWWSGSDDDARPAGKGAIGYRSVNFHATGDNFPAMQDILKYVVSKGKSQVSDPSKVGENLYNRGVMNSVMIAEAIRNAQKISGKKMVTGADVRDGLEAIDLTEARLKELGLEGFTIPMKVTCADHAGAHPVYIQKWNGTNWERDSDWITPMKDIVRPLILAAAEKYVADKPEWQTQTCN